MHALAAWVIVSRGPAPVPTQCGMLDPATTKWIGQLQQLLTHTRSRDVFQ